MSPVFLFLQLELSHPQVLQRGNKDEGKYMHCNLSKFYFITQDLLQPIQISGIWD